MAKNYIIGDYSRQFLDALEAFQVFKNNYYDALTNLYDEEQAAKLFNEDSDKLDAVERAVMEYLRICFIETMGNTTGGDTVVL